VEIDNSPNISFIFFQGSIMIVVQHILSICVGLCVLNNFKTFSIM